MSANKPIQFKRRNPAQAVTQMAEVRIKVRQTRVNRCILLTYIKYHIGSDRLSLTIGLERLLLADSRIPLTRLDSQGLDNPKRLCAQRIPYTAASKAEYGELR